MGARFSDSPARAHSLFWISTDSFEAARNGAESGTESDNAMRASP